MKYKVEKNYDSDLWHGYRWSDSIHDWELINAYSLTKIGCKYAVKRWHKKRKKIITQSEEFELE